MVKVKAGPGNGKGKGKGASTRERAKDKDNSSRDRDRERKEREKHKEIQHKETRTFEADEAGQVPADSDVPTDEFWEDFFSEENFQGVSDMSDEGSSDVMHALLLLSQYKPFRALYALYPSV